MLKRGENGVDIRGTSLERGHFGGVLGSFGVKPHLLGPLVLLKALGFRKRSPQSEVLTHRPRYAAVEAGRAPGEEVLRLTSTMFRCVSCRFDCLSHVTPYF